MSEPEYQWTKEGYVDEFTFMIVYDIDDFNGDMFEAVIIGEYDGILSETVDSEKEAREILKQWCRENLTVNGVTTFPKLRRLNI